MPPVDLAVLFVLGPELLTRGFLLGLGCVEVVTSNLAFFRGPVMVDMRVSVSLFRGLALGEPCVL